jgi:hypothetical protein
VRAGTWLAACLGAAGVFAPAAGGAVEPAGKAAAYCMQGADGAWRLQQFKPLIRAQGGTVFAEMWFAGSALAEVKVRRFSGDSELALDYTFDGAGRLTGLRGSVRVKTTPLASGSSGEKMLFADWVGEAELTPAADGRIPAHHVMYHRETDKIDKPDDADRYIAQFDAAPVYRTAQSVPCGAMLKEAEKMNAAQE